MNFNQLDKYIPNSSIELIKIWLNNFDVEIKIKNERKNKLGDYRIPKKGESHKITINNNLTPELFFLVLTHEIAHLISLNKNRNILPHGNEWKQTFSNLINDSIFLYSQDLQIVLKDFIKNPKASFYAHKKLALFFLSKNEDYKNLQTINDGDKFILNKRVFIKLNKKKTKYICQEISSGRKYLINSLAPIELFNE